MYFLISTSNSFLIWHDSDPHGYRVHSGYGTYYGISYTSDRILVAARRFSLTGSDQELDESRGSILMFDYRLRFVQELTSPFPMRDIHQILCVGDRLFVTMTFDDSVAIYDGSEWRHWRPLTAVPRGARREGGRHFNSLLYSSDLLYLLAHNFGPSEVFIFDAQSLELQRSLPLGNHAHNLWFRDSELLACSSYDHGIVCQSGGVAHTGNYPRGVVATASGQYIGISMFVEDRARRGYPDCFIAQFASNWRPKGCFCVRGEGPLGDLRCLGTADAAHPQLVGPDPDLSDLTQSSARIPIEQCRLPIISL